MGLLESDITKSARGIPQFELTILSAGANNNTIRNTPWCASRRHVHVVSTHRFQTATPIPIAADKKDNLAPTNLRYC